MSQNGNFDPMASWARLSERVENQGKDIVDLRSNMNTGFQTINASLATLSNELRANSKTQWPVIWAAMGVCSTILLAAGTFIYSTLTNVDVGIADDLRAIEMSAVPRQELEWRQARGAEDRARMEGNISDLRANAVTRAEWQERNRARDQEVTDLSRRVEEIRQDFGAIYGTRDVIVDLQERIDRIEMMRRPSAPP